MRLSCFGGTHGNEYEGQVGVKRLCTDLDPEQIAEKHTATTESADATPS